ncbi:SusC/RagA family TonB-linked outer membrane protein [Echinicola rosea]|uniref:SusC/RagA family TonB-linked outer membrane protein n=1 Tax=Echinicola rosea TaxID=1807691 RepID=A0ABQ1VBN9_9BACT|nr:TonB-dependent receptor [Echinicola rosea]GGF48750.1 SusC/RagA family TonB-linked outer membrane protein [Echinicola rosea]
MTKFYNQWSLITLLLLSTGLSAFAQRTISGKITDDTEEGLPGATVLVKGTSNGTVTDLDGMYSIEVPSNESILVFSFVGYESKEEKVGTRSAIDVTLGASMSSLEEVVVTGYTSQSKKDITGAVSSVDSEELQKVPATTFAQQLQGRASGVNIVNDATPGGNATVRIRGFGTIGNNDPLYVIDGVPTQNQGNLNPNDIESIQILKDASAASIYGSRAANGVVIITTKRGKVGKPTIAVSAYYGTQSAANSPEVLNGEELGRYLYLANTYAGRTTDHGQYTYGSNGEVMIPDYVFPSGAMEGDPATNPDLYALEPGNIYPITRAGDTDWWKESTGKAPIQNYQVSAAGGTENGRYALSLNYFNQEGIVNNVGYERYSLRANTEFKALNNKLTIGENLSTSFDIRKGGFSNDDEQNAVSSSYKNHPLLPVYDIMGQFAGSRGRNLGNNYNPVAILERQKDNRHFRIRGFGNVYASYDITDDLIFKTSYGFDGNMRRSRLLGRPQPEYVEGNFINSSEAQNQYSLQTVWTNTLSWSHAIGDIHKVDAYIGTEAIREFGETFTARREKFPFLSTQVLSYLDLGDASTAKNSGEVNVDYSLFSTFGQFNYSYEGKYLVQFILRNDASSRFLQASRSAVFPAFSLGWRLSDELFVRNALPFISDMKLRYGWGKTGNQLIGDYNAYTTYKTNIFNAGYPIDGSTSTPTVGFDVLQFGNRNAKWESTTSNNLGLDVEMLAGKIFFELDLWNRKTTDMLFQVPVSYGHGDAVAPYFNVGQMTNKGMDISLGYNNTAHGRDFSYSISGNYSMYRNNVDQLDEGENAVLFGRATRVPSLTISRAGIPLSSFFGYKVVGIFQTQEEADSWPAYGEYNAPGKFKVQDINEDGVITDADRTIIGNPHPDFNFGINISLGYKNWDLDIFGNGSVGNDIYNYVRYFTDFNTFQGNRSKRALYEAWQPSNPQAPRSQWIAADPSAQTPIMDANDQVSSRPSSYFIEDGSYFRLRNIQLTYHLPAQGLKALGLGSASVYLQGQNLLTFTNYSGLNPEIQVGTENDATLGFDGGYMPVSKSLILGLNISF